ncbi:MAG: hypothetical protein KTR16_12105 [Acidiferrobacterales bacterium]|nr:hypothetical protein [Acidiferrobacterales bacterium]
MRLLSFCIKAVLVVAIVVAVASYLNYLRTGYFWLPSIGSFQIGSSTPNMQTLPPPKDTIYKWREGGEWVYGDAPPESVEAQKVTGDN